MLAGLIAGAVLTAPIVERNIVYSRAAGETLAMDVYQPAEWVRRPAPAIVMIHGGAWIGGKRQDMDALAITMARNGFVVANVSYRLAPKHKWPAMMDDTQTAVRFLRANAAQYGVDAQKIGAAGASAGGHLSMMLGFRETRDPKPTEHAGYSSRVQAIFNFFGPTDMTRDYPPSVADPLMQAVIGKPREQATAEIRDVSPLLHIDRQAPPMFIFQGMADTLVSPNQSRYVEARYRELGLPVEAVYLDGVPHAIPVERPEVRRAIGAGIAFMKRYLSAR